MTPKDQVAEIINLLAPGDTTQTDALFLVQKQVEKSLALASKNTRRIQELEQLLSDAQANVHIVINEKLTRDLERKEDLEELEEHRKEKKRIERLAAGVEPDPELEPGPKAKREKKPKEQKNGQQA